MTDKATAAMPNTIRAALMCVPANSVHSAPVAARTIASGLADDVLVAPIATRPDTPDAAIGTIIVICPDPAINAASTVTMVDNRIPADHAQRDSRGPCCRHDSAEARLNRPSVFLGIPYLR